MKEAPELNVESKDLKPEPEKQFEDTVSGVSGGIPQYEVDQRNVEQARNAEKLADAAKAKDDKVKSLKNKIMGFFGQAPEQLSLKYSKLGEDRMKENPALRKAYENYFATEGEEVAQAYKEAIGKWPYIARDEKGNFVDKTVYSSGTGDVPGDKQRSN